MREPQRNAMQTENTLPQDMASKNTLQKNAEQREDRTGLPLWTAATSYLLGYLYVCCFWFGFVFDPFGHRSWFYLLFTVLFFGWSRVVIAKAKDCKAGLLVKKKAGKAASREDYFWLVCTLLIALAPAVGGGNAVTGLGYLLALHGFAAYWVLCRAGVLTETTTGPFFLWDGVNALLLAPLGNIFLRLKTVVDAAVDGIRSLRRRSSGKLNAKRMGISVCFVLLALPFFALAGKLLSQADTAGFANFWQGMLDLFRFRWPGLPHWPSSVLERLERFVWSLPVGAYLYGLVGGSARRKKPVMESETARRKAEALRIAPVGALSIIFGLFCALYAVFFVFQAGHLFGAFFGVVPGAITASEYAREGFFQLCQVMALNFGLLAVAAKCSGVPLRQNKLLRILALLLMAESLLLAVTAGSKLWLYIDRFGFTPRRLLSSWAVLVLAAGCVLAIVTILKPCRAVQKWVWFAAGSFALLCLY